MATCGQQGLWKIDAYTAQELDEIERSALEAVYLDQSFNTNPQNIARYLNPAPDAAFPLEYAFYLLGDVRGLTVLDYGCGAGATLCFWLPVGLG